MKVSFNSLLLFILSKYHPKLHFFDWWIWIAWKCGLILHALVWSAETAAQLAQLPMTVTVPTPDVKPILAAVVEATKPVERK